MFKNAFPLAPLSSTNCCMIWGCVGGGEQGNNLLRERAKSVHCFLSQTIGVENIVPEDDVEHALCTLKKKKKEEKCSGFPLSRHTQNGRLIWKVFRKIPNN